MPAPRTFCLLVPAYNEELGIEKCVRTLCNALTDYAGAVLIVVNDGSTDRTGEILTALAPQFSTLDTVTCAANGGYGGAVRAGIQRAVTRGFDYALFMDSDLTNDPKYIRDFVEHMNRGVDVIKASRYVSGGKAEGVPAYRVAISVVGNWLARTLCKVPLRDCTNGYQAMKVDLLKQMPLKERGFAVIMEELYYARYFATTFAEVPYTLTARTEHIRKSSFYYRPRAFYQYLKYPLKSFLGIRPAKGLFHAASGDGTIQEETRASHELSRL